MPFCRTLGSHNYHFKSLKELLAKASPQRSADELAEIAADSEQERVAAQYILADLELSHFLNEALIPYEEDEVTRLIIDTHDGENFKTIAHHTVGSLREFLLDPQTDTEILKTFQMAFTPEMIAAVSKLMRNQDLIAVAKKCTVTSQFRNTQGLTGHLSTRLQPNHPTDDVLGIAASIFDGLLLGSGDAVIGINPVQDNPNQVLLLLELIERLRLEWDIPTQSCVLAHVTTLLKIIEHSSSAPVDLIFQSIGGTEALNKSFGISLSILKEAWEAGLSLKRGSLGKNLMYFETGQGSALSSDAHHGVDAQTCEARAYAVARTFEPLLVNSVVGFIGPEYLFDAKQITRAGLEDHFCAKVLGLPMGMDVCYTNHAEADQNDMDNLISLLTLAGCNFFMGVPGADDIMLHYQSTSFHDALYLRQVFQLKPAPEFYQWLQKMNLMDQKFLPCDNSKLLNTKLLESLR